MWKETDGAACRGVRVGKGKGSVGVGCFEGARGLGWATRARSREARCAPLGSALGQQTTVDTLAMSLMLSSRIDVESILVRF